MAHPPALRVTLLDAAGAAGHTVRVDYTETGRCARLLEGSPPENVPDMLARLYAICSKAQALAGRLALCAAQGRTPDADTLATLRVQVSLEALRETALHVLLVWPRLTGEPVLREAAAAVMAATRGGDDGHDGTAIAQALADAVFGDDPASWLRVCAQTEGACAWLREGRTQAARFLSRAIAQGDAGIHPAPAVTSPLGRNAHEGLLTGFEAGSLAAHHAVRLLELARLAASFASGAPQPAACTFASLGPGQGEARVQCARGELVHRVALADGRVARYAVHSPTDEAFAPFGSARMWLQSVADTTLGWSRARREVALAEVLVAIDPCVDYRLGFEDTHLEGVS